MLSMKALKNTVAVVTLALASATASTALADPVRIAFGDIASVESLHLLAALERAKEMGVEIEVTYLKSEDIAAQAVVGGQADIGIGAPYALIQKVNAPVRMFLQLSELNFYPIVNSEFYKTWKDLDGQEIAVHSRGSGTEAIMKLMAEENGITYSNISYVPGAEVRTGALLQGNVKASIVDSSGRRVLDEQAPGKFLTLPLGDVSATDEALFANTEFLKENSEDVAKIVEAILTTWREVQTEPASVAAMRDKYKLLPDLPANLVADIEPYFAELAKGGLSVNGGSEQAVKDDLAFFTLSGQVEGKPEELKVADFWELGPVTTVVAKIGSK